MWFQKLLWRFSPSILATSKSPVSKTRIFLKMSKNIFTQRCKTAACEIELKIFESFY